MDFGGEDKDDAEGKAQAMIDALDRGPGPPWSRMITDPDAVQTIWEVRKSGLAATAHVPMMAETHPGWEDAAVPPDHVGPYLRDFRALLDRYGYDCALYDHFGDGCIHCRIDFDYGTLRGVQDYLSFIEEAADLVVSHGGSLSGEHGDGQSRGALLERMYGPELVGAFRDFKRLWDPEGRMNPGKVVDPWLPTQNLRAGPDYRPWHAEVQFAYPEDRGDFAARRSAASGWASAGGTTAA